MRTINNKGVTLIELLVVLLIVSLVMGGIYTIVSLSEKSWAANKVKIELQQELRKAMEWMVNDLRQAGDLSIEDVPSDGVWYSTITFKIPSGVISGGIDWEDDTIQFMLTGANSNELVRVHGAETKHIADGIQSLQFRRQAATPKTLEVTMQASKNAIRVGTITYELDFEVQLRN